MPTIHPLETRSLILPLFVFYFAFLMGCSKEHTVPKKVEAVKAMDITKRQIKVRSKKLNDEELQRLLNIEVRRLRATINRNITKILVDRLHEKDRKLKLRKALQKDGSPSKEVEICRSTQLTLINTTVVEDPPINTTTFQWDKDIPQYTKDRFPGVVFAPTKIRKRTGIEFRVNFRCLTDDNESSFSLGPEGLIVEAVFAEIKGLQVTQISADQKDNSVTKIIQKTKSNIEIQVLEYIGFKHADNPITIQEFDHIQAFKTSHLLSNIEVSSETILPTRIHQVISVVEMPSSN